MHKNRPSIAAVALVAAALLTLAACATTPPPPPNPGPPTKATTSPSTPAPAPAPAPQADGHRVTGLGGAPDSAEGNAHDSTQGSSRGGRGGAVPNAAPTPAPAPNAVELTLYVMSKCPYAVQAEDAIIKAVSALPGAVKLKLEYIVSEDTTTGQLKALHGLDEVRGNILQLCVQHNYAPDTFIKFLRCQNRSWRQIPAGWERCARKAGIPEASLSACFNGGAGEQLLRDSMLRAKAIGAKGSPTIYIAGKRYSGGRGKRDFMRGVCNAYADAERPASCAQIPKPVQVQLTVLSDRRCTHKTCNTAGLITNLRARFFPALTVRQLDYSDPEGKRLFRELKLKRLPVLLLAPGVKKAVKYRSIARWLRAQGPYLRLRTPARFDPTAEICDNKKDDTGNGRVDCADRSCRKNLLCRRLKRRNLQVFVMSQCPYAVRALDAMKDVLSNFKGRLRFDIHYIAEQTDDGGFKALHGQPEVEENIRQLCAKKYYRRGNKYLNYIWCRNRNFRSSDWKPCATGGISAKRIERCASGALGKRLLARDLKEAKALHISGSPTFLANNRNKFNGISADKIKTEVCKYNPRLPGCSNTLSTPKDAPAGGACK